MKKFVYNKKIIIYLIILVAFYVTECFFDVIMTTRHGINFWHALFDGEILRFYSYNVDAVYLPEYGKTMSALYNILEYIIFAIWDFPLWIFEKISGASALSYGVGIIYAKMVNLPFLLGCGYCINEIITNVIKTERCKSFLYLMLASSPIMLATVIGMGQYDTISLFFILCGINAYMKRDDRRFILFFAIAIPLKMFAILFFVPLLVLREKKVVKILTKGALAVSVYGVTTILELVIDYAGAMNFSAEHLVGLVLRNNVQLSLEPISVMFLFFSALTLWCYLKDADRVDDSYIMKICLCSSLFGVIIPSHPQWLLYLVPFLCILGCTQEKQLGQAIVLETVSEVALILSHIIYYRTTCSANMVDIMWPGRIFGRLAETDNWYSIFDYLASRGLESGVNAIMKVCLALAVASIVVFGAKLLFKNSDDATKISIKEWWYIRAICGIILLNIPVLSYILYIV